MGSWYVNRGGIQYGPYPEDQLKSLAEAGRIVASDMMWTEGTENWVPASSVPGLTFSPMPPPPPSQPGDSSVSGTKIAAGVCAIMFGSLGVHKFIIGATTAGVIMLLATVLSCGLAGIAMSVIGIVEGIIYLTKSDEEFNQIYLIGKRAWF